MHRLSTTPSRSLRRAAAKAAKPTLARGAHKEIKFSNEGRASILKGVDVLANAVSVTLGPKGQSLLIFLLLLETQARKNLQVVMLSSSSPLAGPKLPKVSEYFTYWHSLFSM